MYIVSAEEMRKLDHYMIHTIGLSALTLMENAGREIARVVQNKTAQTEENLQKRWLILVGKGNNGGDGLVAARHLLEAGIPVAVMYAEEPENLTKEAAIQRSILSKIGVPATTYSLHQQSINATNYFGIIDALLGIGSKGAPREPYASLIRQANESGLPIIAVDIPSGLDADTGALYEPCIQATETIALAFIKRGLVQYPGADAAGEILVKPIGMLPSIAEQLDIKSYLVTNTFLEKKLQPCWHTLHHRTTDSHKGTYGHTLVVAGSRTMSGAGLLASKAALRAGCGLTTWAVPASILEQLLGHVPEVMLKGIPDSELGDWEKTEPKFVLELTATHDAVAVGPGMGRFSNDTTWLRSLWEGVRCPLLLDADALNMLADAPDFASWRTRDAATILTPHPGEMARLAGIPVHEVQRDRIALARRYATEHGVTLVLKGARTLVATPAGTVYVNTTGNAGMATGGAGDVLAGVITSLLAQGCDAEHAAVLGVYLHGAAGDRAAAKRHSPASLIAGDIIDEL